jgi:hypothetical protein
MNTQIHVHQYNGILSKYNNENSIMQKFSTICENFIHAAKFNLQIKIYVNYANLL